MLISFTVEEAFELVDKLTGPSQVARDNLAKRIQTLIPETEVKLRQMSLALQRLQIERNLLECGLFIHAHSQKSYPSKGYPLQLEASSEHIASEVRTNNPTNKPYTDNRRFDVTDSKET